MVEEIKFESEEILLDKVRINIKPISMAKIRFDYTEEHPDKFITRLKVVLEEDNTYVKIYGYDIKENKQFYNNLPSDIIKD